MSPAVSFPMIQGTANRVQQLQRGGASQNSFQNLFSLAQPSRSLHLYDHAMFKAGVGFYALFGVGWLMLGIGHFGGTFVAVGLPLGLLVALGLMLGAKRRLGDAVGGPPEPHQRKRFAQVNAAQWVLIGVVAVAFGTTGHPVLIPPLVAVIVGAHFLPLARAFAQPRMRVTAALLIAVGLVGAALTAVPAAQNVVPTVVGLGCALTLWGTAAWTITSVGSIGNEARSADAPA